MNLSRVLFAVLLTLGMATTSYAACTEVTSATTPFRCTTVVYNDSGSAQTSGTVVVWDTDDSEYDNTGYPYVTTTTTGDHDHIAGVLIDDSCANGALCQMVYYGWAPTRVAQSTDVAAEDTQVSTSSVDGMAGDWGAGANTCSLGMLLNARDHYTGATAPATDGMVFPVFVNPGCED